MTTSTMSTTTTKTKTVITGIGIAAANGLGPTGYWRALMNGQSGLGPVTRFDVSGYRSKIAAEVPDFAAARHLPNRLLPQTDHITRLSLVASDWALKQANVTTDDIPSTEIGVVTAAAGGGYEYGQRELAKLHSKGPSFVSAYQSFAWFYAVNTGQISIRHGLRGASSTVVSDQAGGLDAIAHARRLIRHGDNQVTLIGGFDSALCPWAWASHQSSGRMSEATDPAAAFLPFDERANGFAPGEGGAIMVLEAAETAIERPGVRIYGEIAGYAATFDARRPNRDPGFRRAIELALADANAGPSDIDVIFADAAGEPEADRAEAEAITEIFGPRGVPVTAPKTMTGRLFAGGASLDVATALLALYWDAIPPTINVREVDPEFEIDLVLKHPRHRPLRTALVLARGLGGFNSAMVVRKF
ncbi:MAG: Beta-ketoacyl synthase [Glaciihabitans sp.]|nr:Beta-ketoacyl synthase [Glaciihabitans sp.]